MQHAYDVPLATLTTFGLGGPAKRLVTIESEEDVAAAFAEADRDGDGAKTLVLGGGSNLVVSDDGFPGTAVRLATRGIAHTRDGDDVLVAVEAGEPWDPFVHAMVDEGLSGIECLAGIPGLVGATPIQNVGAYGQEVSDTIVRVRVFDRTRSVFEDLSPEACAFGYRASRFKGDARYVVTRVTFRLRKARESRPVRYAELARTLGVPEGGRGPLDVVRDTVVRLRRGKGMVLDPGDPESRSAGSFFMNPIVTSDVLADVERRADLRGALRPGETMPRFPAADGRVKLSAGWLIERAGFTRGYGGGAVGVSKKHALALVHRGGGTTRELLALARTIRDGVASAFGVVLVPEPLLVGCALTG